VSNKHNKKRNTGFLYEILARGLTKAIIEEDTYQKKEILNLLREFFSQGTVLRKDLECYKSLTESANLSQHLAEKVLHETKLDRSRLNSKKIFDNQTDLIKKINMMMADDAWNTFVPNYKSLASVNAIFNQSTSPKKRVLYEDTVVRNLSEDTAPPEQLKPIDNLVYRSFVEKFNDEYNDLLQEQKTLLSRYVASFADNGLEFKLYLDQEIGRLKTTIAESLRTEEIENDSLMAEKTHKVLHILEGFKEVAPDQHTVRSVLKIQALVKEINS